MASQSRVPGVIEATANLDDAIKAFAQSPGSFESEMAQQNLMQLYSVAGSGGATTVLDRCMRIVRDPGETMPSKLVTIRILDLLLTVEQEEQLAKAFALQLRFYMNIAKRSKEKERKKRRPTGMFSTTVGDDDVAHFVAGVGELLDKWGRIFDEAPHDSSLREITKARQELLQEHVKLPQPENYTCIPPHRAGASKLPGGSPGSTSPSSSGALDEAQLSRFADDFRDTLGRLGAEAQETVEAHSRFQAELDRWQRSAQEAADRGDFEGVQRFSEVAFRFAQIGNELESSASASVTPATSGASTPMAPPPPASPSPGLSFAGAATVGQAAARHKKRHHHGRKDRSPSPGGGADFSPPEAGFSPWPQQPQPQEPAFGGSFTPEQPFGGSFGSQFGTFATPQPPPEVPSTGPLQGVPAEPPSGFAQPGGALPPSVFSPAGPDLANSPLAMGLFSSSFPQDAAQGPAQPSPLPPPPAPAQEQRGPGGPSDREAGLLRANMQLQSQFQALQEQNQKLQGQLDQRASENSSGAVSSEQLRAALRRLRELEPVQAQLADARSATGSLTELNNQLQGELDHCRRELRTARQQAAVAEEKLAEREELLSETRQRLFDAKQRHAQLEDEMKNQAEMHKSMQSRLESARADRIVTETELQTLRHVVSSAGGLTQAQPPPSRGNQPYGLKHAGVVVASGPKTSARVPPSVSNGDELAGSALSCGGGFLQGDGTPLQQLARRQANGFAETPALGGPERGPAIPRSQPEVWRRTPRIARPPGAVVLQTPPASRSCLERTNANFQRLLVQPRGPLYEDQGVLMDMSISVGSASAGGGGRPCVDFEVGITNRSGQTLHDVRLQPSEGGAHSGTCELRIEAEPRASSALSRQQQRRFRGRLEVFGPFETGPKVDFSYLLPDNLSLTARLRLPLAITRFMSPPRLEAVQVVELWSEPELAHSEVAVVCTLRGSLLSAGAPFSVWKCMELGGVFRCFPGFDENPRGVVFASSYPQRQGLRSEVLVRAECGGYGDSDAIPRSGSNLPFSESAACRVAVRSASHEVNRALAQVFLDVLCDAPEPAAAA